MIYASSSRRALLSAELFGDLNQPENRLPDDAVPITEAEVAALRAAEQAGKVLDWSGPKPVAVDPAPPELALIKKRRIDALGSDCEAQILAGFDSTAMGIPHSYPAKVTDQINLTASVVSSLMPGLPEGWTTPFWCRDVFGEWAYVPHTAAQIQAVGADGKAAILAALERKATLEALVMAAPSAEAAEAINWSDETD